MAKNFLSRDEILKASQENFETVEVEVPEWGGTVRVREMTAKQVEMVGFRMSDKDGVVDVRLSQGLRVKMVIWCCLDSDGSQMFTEEDTETLEQSKFGPIKKISDAVIDLSGLGEDDDEEGKETGESEPEKN